MIETRESWRTWVTPKPLRASPVHRWYAFPHSFTGELVDALIEEWGLSSQDHILDPFAGAGTTVLAARLQGVPAQGYDLSPLATFVSKVKTRTYNVGHIQEAWSKVEKKIQDCKPSKVRGDYSELVKKALPNGILATFEGIDRAIDAVATSAQERDFFRLALLAILPIYSRAVATGGWLKWVTKRTKQSSIVARFSDRVQSMIDDLEKVTVPKGRNWSVARADARALPDSDRHYTAIITSPPYPNRHDYTRVFGVELLYGFLNWEQMRKVRYQSIHSHPESRPRRPLHDDYVPPYGLRATLKRMRDAALDPKILKMLEGYFLDMHLCLKECRRVAKARAKIAFVVGNAQYRGNPVPVDQYLARIGENLGLQCHTIRAVRFRGNSAQQMGQFGRNPSRESVVVFTTK